MNHEPTNDIKRDLRKAKYKKGVKEDCTVKIEVDSAIAFYWSGREEGKAKNQRPVYEEERREGKIEPIVRPHFLHKWVDSNIC